MSDFKRHIEEGRQAKDQSVPLNGHEPEENFQNNRIEELLRRRVGGNAEPLMPVLESWREPAVREVVRRHENSVVREPAEPAIKRSKRKYKFKSKLRLAVLVLAVGAIGWSGYSLIKDGSVFGIQLIHSKEMSTEEVIASVGKLVGLPQGEDPTIATITDLEPLKSQAFFNNAMVGDKLLVFSKSKIAILYRPSENKVIEVAPLNN